jgi:hypothetical protein
MEKVENTNEYQVLETHHNDTVENWYILIKDMPVNEESLTAFVKRFRSKNCEKPANIYLIDDASALPLILKYPLEGEEYAKAAKHFVALAIFDLDDAWMYPYVEKMPCSITEEYPKLLAIGCGRVGGNDSKRTLIYLLEDESLFYGYAQNPEFRPRVKPGWTMAVALRWCQGLILPKGNEDVHKLYSEALEIIRKDKIRGIDKYLCEKGMAAKHGKEYDIDLKATQERTLANPNLSKYFL